MTSGWRCSRIVSATTSRLRCARDRAVSAAPPATATSSREHSDRPPAAAEAGGAPRRRAAAFTSRPPVRSAPTRARGCPTRATTPTSTRARRSRRCGRGCSACPARAGPPSSAKPGPSSATSNSTRPAVLGEGDRHGGAGGVLGGVLQRLERPRSRSPPRPPAMAREAARRRTLNGRRVPAGGHPHGGIEAGVAQDGRVDAVREVGQVVDRSAAAALAWSSRAAAAASVPVRARRARAAGRSTARSAAAGRRRAGRARSAAARRRRSRRCGRAMPAARRSRAARRRASPRARAAAARCAATGRGAGPAR